MRLKPLLLIALTALSARAEFNAERALAGMPAEILEPLMPQTLLDLVEYAREGMFDHAEKNAFGGDARIEVLGPMRAEVVTGVGRTLTLDLLTAKGDTLIALIETLETPVRDSHLTVYDRNWQPRPKMWTEPKGADWFTEQGRKNSADVREKVPFILSEYSFNPATGILTLTNRTDDTIYTKPSLTYNWTPKGFRPIAR